MGPKHERGGTVWGGEDIQSRGLLHGEAEGLLRPLLRLVPDGALILDSDLKILEANQRTCEIYGMPSERFTDRDLRDLVAPSSRRMLDRALMRLCGSAIWRSEAQAQRADGTLLSIEILLSRVELQDRILFLAVIRDLSELKELSDRLFQETARREELNVTLHHVMKAIDQERKRLEVGVAHKIETLLLPALEKVRRAPSKEIRDSFLDIMREELVFVTKGFSKELSGRFLKLTRAEMEVCQLIRAGLSSKDIASSMNRSLETIQTHRKNIRKKLGVRGKKINLYAFLKTG